EQYHEKLLRWINPNGSAGESIVTVALLRKIVAARRFSRGHIPSQGARRIADLNTFYKLLDDSARQNARVRVNAAIQHCLREHRDVVRRAEKPCVARDSAHCVRISVVNFAVQQTLAVSFVFLRRRDTPAQCPRRVKE